MKSTTSLAEVVADVIDDLVSRFLFARDLWRDAQEHGLPWAPVRRPEENASDEHWLVRGAFFDVHHPELGETFTYTGAKWLTEGLEWPRPPRPPLVGEHTDEVRAEWAGPGARHRRVFASARAGEASEQVSVHGKPFALSGVRVIDLSWMLASGGAGRFLAAMGAEVIKVEHISRPDAMRFSRGACPPGGRAERDAAAGPLPTPPTSANPNRGGAFMEINAGKMSLSLNLKHPSGRRILEDLIRDADMIVEGFSPGTMTRMGLSYERLRELNPSIIYIQQSGFGETGTYGRARAYGPTAQAITGLSDMSGLPEPYPPAGIGYSYLDWFGAYNMAVAMLAALYRRDVTGEGCHIDASQAETGIYLTGTAVLDHSVNGRRWSRYGNRSPYKPAAPHGAYRTLGADRWIAISAFTEQQWQSVITALGAPAWSTDPRFATLQLRIEHQEEPRRAHRGIHATLRRLHADERASGTSRPGRRMPDRRGPVRNRPAARPPRLARRTPAIRNRHLASQGTPCHILRDTHPHRRPPQPVRTQLRRRHRAHPQAAPQPQRHHHQPAPQRRRPLRAGWDVVNIWRPNTCRAMKRGTAHDRYRVGRFRGRRPRSLP